MKHNHIGLSGLFFALIILRTHSYLHLVGLECCLDRTSTPDRGFLGIASNLEIIVVELR